MPAATTWPDSLSPERPGAGGYSRDADLILAAAVVAARVGRVPSDHRSADQAARELTADLRLCAAHRAALSLPTSD